MSIHVALRHLTHYQYDRPVTLGPQVIRLRPAPHCRTRILSYSLDIKPDGHFINWQQDPQGNYMARLVFPEKTREFRVAVDLVAEMSVLNPFDFFLSPNAETFPFTYTSAERRELTPFLIKAPATPLLARYLAEVSREPRRTIDFIVELNQKVANDIKYLIRMEPGVQLPETTLRLKSGSCRDSAELLVNMFRHLGLAARFVSGYLIQLKADVKPLDGPAGTDKDFTDLHAWCEVYLPGGGWIGLDATSGLLAGEGHIPLACTPEPSQAAPISGGVDEAEVQFHHEMGISRIWEAPRVTKPYSDEQWSAIVDVGHAVDAQLAKDDVRLTMGGEPTFVAVDDPDGAEWNTAALGPTKRLRAAELFRRLKEKYAPQGLAHFGQGKWYPGEQLPRWSLNLYWRKDGEPIWGDPERYADESVNHGVTADSGAALLRSVARQLGLDGKYVFPSYEDVYYYLWRERRLPANVDPFDAKLDDEMERARLRKVFEQGLNTTVGYALPVSRDATDSRWQTGPWFLRAERCYLLPGDSPMGYRMPLDSQPWVSKSDYPYLHPADPSQTFAPLPLRAQLVSQLRPLSKVALAKLAADEKDAQDKAEQERAHLAAAAAGKAATEGADAADRDAAKLDEAERARRLQPLVAGKSAGFVTRTALCAEPRNGVLYVFMPPLQSLESYLQLVAAVETSAATLDLKVVLEGYEPPSDPRLSNLRVTPDPGVIEVNVQPSKSWDELVERTEHLYQVAHETRLSSEKFMLDGRHTGTGGGNHFVLGGASTQDSPFLRRPDVLASLLAYWHNHPSLSYLFSGLFIGPTSQAPRVDEARNDSLYELEIAMRELRARGQNSAPWFVDRALRNLLIDVSGNTHRAEFCIDKLYSPDGPTGRLGLLELRAFEMPPHARMSLTQQLLLRSLVSRFWREPYEPARLARWGTELHDRFLLPYFVEQDLADVLTEQREAGYPLDPAWFAPHMEFRFPKHGDYETRGVEMEIRHALEPWHVMGEEGSAGGTVRYVDSSVERLQVKVTGLAPDRYTIACNGHAVPLRPTGTVGEFVAGVRYRAWQPPNALHPSIGVNAPLTFDLVDTWMHRSLGGCQYHVAHPGGRGYDTFPVNAFEAESRRLARFFRLGHTQGRVSAPAVRSDVDFPFTLDLRRAD
ncbi:MAG: transglutaminase family protein [Pseudomonadota bacterium]